MQSPQTNYASWTSVYAPAPSVTTSAPVSNSYAYDYPIPGVTTPPTPSPAADQYPTSSSTSTATAVPITHIEVSTPSQGAIIAIGVICGLLLLALFFVILVIIGKRYEWQQLHVDIEGGGGAGGHHRRRRRHRSEKTVAEYGGWELDDTGRPRVPSGMSPAFFRPGPRPNVNGNLGIAPHYFPDLRAPHPGVRKAAQEKRGDIEEGEDAEELSETSSTGASGTRTVRPESENRHHSSKVSSLHTRGRHRGT
jgi:hypothetical protein